MNRIIGLLTHAVPKNIAGSFEHLRALPFLILPSGDTLFEYSLSQLHRASNRVLICIDEVFYEDKEKYVKLSSGYSAELVFLKELNGYSSCREASLRMERTDLIFSMQLGYVVPLSFSFSFVLNKFKNLEDWGQIMVFGENFLDPKNNGQLTLERNIKSLSIPEFGEAGFVSSSGKLVRWNGLLLMKNEAIVGFYLEEKKLDNEYAHLLPGTSTDYNLQIPQACDLSELFGTRVYSKTAFFLLTIDTRVYILLLENDFQDFIEDMDPCFSVDYNAMIQRQNNLR